MSVVRDPREDPLTHMLFNNTGTVVKNVYSTFLLVFSIIIIAGLIFEKQTSWSKAVHPVFALIMLFGAVLWLSMVEGGQASLVGLAPVKSEIFKDSHPKSYVSCKVCHSGDNLERYLMGRQFMVLALVFIINNCGAPVGGAELWGMPEWITTVFLETGWAMILFTCMVGQLNTQVNASHCMLDYINNYFAIFTFWTAMGIEFSGLLHSSYLIQMIVAAASGQTVDSYEEPRTPLGNGFFWGRIYMSLVIVTFCVVVIIGCLFADMTTIWDGVPHIVALILFVLLLSVVGLLEGMQIAFFAVAKLPASERGDSKFAQWTCELLFRGDGYNLPGFMIGRQLCVVTCFFVIARVVTFNDNCEYFYGTPTPTVQFPGGGFKTPSPTNRFDQPNFDDGWYQDRYQECDDPIWGLGSGFIEFFKTGLHGAIVTTIIGSIAWQLVASAFPIAILSFPGTYILLRWCLFLEATGIANGAYVIAWVHRSIKGFQRDEVYIGTAEERAASGAHLGVRSSEKKKSGSTPEPDASLASQDNNKSTDYIDEFTADKQFEQGSA